MTALTGYHDGPPLGPGTHFPDHAVNPYHATFSVIAALRHKRLTGRGMKIDLSQAESTLNAVGAAFMEWSMTGEEPARLGNRSAIHAPHNIFRCKGEDEWCAIAVLTDEQWQSLCKVIGRADLAGDTRYASAMGRVADVARLEEAVTAWSVEKSAFEVMTSLQSLRVPAGVVESARALMDEDPQLRQRGYWQEVDHAEMGMTHFASPPYLLDGERVKLQPPPLLGEHTDDVLNRVLQYSDVKIKSLRDQGVLR